MGNNYFKKYYGEDEVNVVEITQIRLKFIACLVNFRKKVFYIVIRREKNEWFVLFPKLKNEHNIFMQVCN